MDVKFVVCDPGLGVGRDFIGNLEIRSLGRAMAEVGHCSLTLLGRCAAAGRQMGRPHQCQLPSGFSCHLQNARAPFLCQVELFQRIICK